MKVTTENENLTYFKDWDSDALLALWTARFGEIQHINARRIRLQHKQRVEQRPTPDDDEVYFESVGKELFKRKLLTRVVSGENAYLCTLVLRGSNADR